MPQAELAAPLEWLSVIEASVKDFHQFAVF